MTKGEDEGMDEHSQRKTETTHKLLLINKNCGIFLNVFFCYIKENIK